MQKQEKRENHDMWKNTVKYIIKKKEQPENEIKWKGGREKD